MFYQTDTAKRKKTLNIFIFECVAAFAYRVRYRPLKPTEVQKYNRQKLEKV